MRMRFGLQLTTLAGVCALAVWCAVLPVRADVVQPGMRNLSYCFELSDTSAFADYAFLISFGPPTGGYAVYAAGDCVQFYKFASPRVYAIRRAALAQTQLPPASDEKAQQAFFATNRNLIPSDFAITPPGPVPSSSPLRAVTDVIWIAAITPTGLTIVPGLVRYTDADGRTESLPYLGSMTRPEPSPHRITRLSAGLLGDFASGWSWGSALISGVALVATLLLAGRRWHAARRP